MLRLNQWEKFSRKEIWWTKGRHLQESTHLNSFTTHEVICQQSTHQNTNSSDSVNLSGKECVNSLMSQIGKLRFHLAGGLPNAVRLMGCGPSPSHDSQTSVGSFFTAIWYKHQGRKSINSDWTCWAESCKWTSNVSTSKNTQGLEQCWRHLPGLFLTFSGTKN